ncbi:MAG TPA: zinc ribbon domain-containing protein [Gaiellaceae bacterium]|nr:zinc ribbon domain-containing protein [Gaiellaceae bacterium]
MARPRFPSRSRGADAEHPKPVPVRRPAPGVLRRERRALQKLREQRLRDLGGLLLEMYRRGTFREELLSERSADLVAIETRLADIEAALAAPRRHPPRCSCGAPLLPGARFCPSCGRQLRPPGNGTGAAADETIVVRAGDEQ